MGMTFGYRFRLRFGLRPMQADRLLTTDLTAEAIAEAAGFSHTSHLHSGFITLPLRTRRLSPAAGLIAHLRPTHFSGG